MDIQKYLQTVGEWALTSGLQIVVVLVLMAVALKAINLGISRFFKLKREEEDIELKKRADTLRGIVRSGVTILIFVVAGMMVLKQLGIEIGPILAAAGVLGLAVGFGAQKLVEDVISGFFILLEDQVRVGDVVQIGDKGGLVERVTLRMVILRDLSGNVHFIRNGSIGVVTNMTKDYSMFVFDIGVAYREDTDEVVRVIKEIDEGLRRDAAFKDDILAPIEVLGVDKFADSAVVIKARTKTRPVKQWGVAREFNRRLKKRFDELGIEIPFPHTTLYMGQDKKGGAPALNVRVEKKG
ncbi:MAG: mechanosensitive ion channel family protein [Deltaproteobacteria bacterium]